MKNLAFNTKYLLLDSKIFSIFRIILIPIWIFLRGDFGPIPYHSAFIQFAIEWPKSQLSPGQEYIRTSPVGQILFRLSPNHDTFIYFALHFIAIIIAFITIYIAAKKVDGHKYALRITEILIIGQVGFVLFRWIGCYDAFTVLVWALIALFYFYEKYPFLLLSWALLGFQNFEQGLAGLVVLVLCTKGFELHHERKKIFYSFFFLFLGKTALESIIFVMNGEIHLGRLNYLNLQVINRGALDVVTNLPFYLWSILFPFGLLLFFGIKNSWILPLRRISLGLICSVIFSVAAIDHTRVFILITFPTIIWVLIYWVPKQEKYDMVISYLYYLSWIFVPGMLWGGEIVMGYGHYRQIFDAVFR